MPAPRTKQAQKVYDEYMANGGLKDGCPLCDAEAVQEFGHWKIIVNRFPYDMIARKHHMIVPLRHVAEDGLSQAEAAELAVIKNGYIASNYEYMLEATVQMKSIPAHFHLHLLDFLDELQS